ncbi:MAG: sigma-70 family RNA polymerase sigma factor [Clostridia bacterium]
MNYESEFMNELYNKYFFDIVRYCKALLAGDEVLAVDCAHTVFDEARNNISKLKKHKNVAGWLMLTAKHRVMRTVRGLALKRIRETDIDEMAERYEESLSYIQNYEIELSDTDIENKKQEILNSLSLDERHIYDMYYKDRKKQKEIALELNVSSDAVRMRLVRIKRKITDILMQK